MWGWAKFVQGLVSLAAWVSQQLTRYQFRQDGIKEQRLKDDEAKIELQKNVSAVDRAFDANADRMRARFGTPEEPPKGSSER